MNLVQKSATEISPVPLSSKFYGESESDNQNIDLYRKIMIFDEKMMSKIVILWGVPPPIYTRADLKGNYTVK